MKPRRYSIIVKLFSLVMILGILIPTGWLSIPTPVVRADTTTTVYASDLDAYVAQDVGTANYGNAQTLNIRSYKQCILIWCTDYNRRAFVRFNLPTLPTGATLISAQLRLYMSTALSENRTYEARRVNTSWTEGSITWNNQPVSIGSGVVTADNLTTTGWKTWDVTADVQGFYSGLYTNYGWMIRDQSEGNGSDLSAAFRSSENSANTDPELVIVYNRPPTAPALTSPTDGAYVSNNRPTLSWNASTDPDGDSRTYGVSIDGGAFIATGASTNYTPPTALSEGNHTWRARACDSRVCTESTIWSFTVDTDTPNTPAYLYEGSPDQNYYPNTTYNLTIYWGSVTDTGSGITYQLQRRVNGGAWSDRYTGPNTSFADTGSFNDNDLIEYQVRARTGAGINGGWRSSNGIRIDSTDPATVSGVGEGVAIGADDDWSRDNVYWVYWNRVADTGSGISYQVQRSANGGAWIDLTLQGYACDATRCWGDDPAGYSDGDNLIYRLRAVNGAGRTSLTWSAPSDGVTIDFSPPDSNVATGGVYTPVSWPGRIEGSASDGGSGVAFVDLRIYDTDAAAYWSGSDWSGTAASWLRASGGTAWSYTFPSAYLIDGHNYVVDSRAVDVAGNVETSWGTNNFLYAAGAPDAPAPWSTTHPDPDAWYNNNQPSFEWNEPASPIGVAGYSILLDQYPGTVPDKIQDTTQRTYDAATTPDGVWYLHVRAIDNAGQWGPAGHVRVQIDTAVPQTPAGVTESSPDVDWHAGGALTVYWSSVPNTGSGIAYALERCVDGGLSGACATGWQAVASGIATTLYADTISSTDGGTVRYRVRAVNGVGNAGSWRESDGLTIDSDIPATPVWVYEDAVAEPDRDYHNQAGGAVTVRWATVADTGSGVSYRLEKQVNGGAWTLVAQGLTSNSHADSGSYNDDDVILYRVVAINGVGAAGVPRLSDGFRIDLGIPTMPAWVREGTSSDPDWDYDYDGTFTVYWAAVANTGSGITYRLEKSVNDGAWELVAEGLSATNRVDTNSEAQAPDGAFIRYRVTPINGAGTAGPYRLSNGITLDRETPAMPAWINENSPDVDFDADGAVWVNWAPVANTGSGITYNLQKRVDSGSWFDLVSNLTAASYNDTDTFGDDVLIEYRVLARNGVGRISAYATSDGVRVDRDTPDQVSGVGEGLVAGADLDYVNVNSFVVYWNAVSPTADGDQVRYTVERNVNGGGWQQAVSGHTAIAWDDPQAYSNGDQVIYRVTAVNGAGTAGMVSAASDGIVLDTGRPNSVVATSGYYNATSWPDRVQGTASDDYSGVARVEVTIYDTDANLWWNGSAWAAGGPFWLLASGTTNWQYALSDAYLTDGHAYDLQSRATDVAGNVQTNLGANSFIFAQSGPQAPVISSLTHPNPDTWYNHNDPVLDWTTPDGPAPIVGYSYVLDQNPNTTPDTVYETTGNTASYLDVSDGVWYFHVRALDNANNWGPAAHYRIRVDTATPNAPALVTEEQPDIDWDYDGAVTVYWTAVPNTGSGIVYVVERQVDAGAWIVLDDTVPSTLYFDPGVGYADGAVIRYRVSARNGVGLTGAATTSDGFIIDSDMPVSPDWVAENQPAPNDQDYDPDGSVRVYWAAVSDTGSGLTYNVERRITVGGIPGSWVQIASGFAGTSFLDPRANQDGETLHYRITAVNGVGSLSASSMSDGITIDTDTPGAPAEVTENSPDIDWSLDGSIVVFWGGVADTGSGITFRLEKQVNNGVWTLVDGALPGGATSRADSGSYNDGDVIRYRVRAVNGADTVGAWRESDGLTIDSSPVAAPAWVREENPDVDYHASGALTVYWAAVSDTGSGITYRLEKELNNSGVWNVVAQGLVATSYYDGQTQPDATIVHYRVTAINGVHTAGSATASDGVVIDNQFPAMPTGLGEGDVVDTDDEFDQDNTFYIYWTAPADTGSGLTFEIQKSINGGTWVAAAAGIAATWWEDPVPYSNGDTVQYRVRAVTGAGLEGAWSAASSGITLDFIRPDSSITTRGYYNLFNWPGFILGAASDTGSDVAVVHITVQRASDGQYWNGSGWQGSPAWLVAAGTINWQYAFTPADGETYDIRSRATDYADNVEVTLGVGSFTYSSSGPQAPEISSPTHPNEATWYANNSPTLNWTEPASVAPVVGYSYVLDQNPGTTPDAVADTVARTFSFSGLTDGVWYFHVRALDDAGNWGPADHFALHIDTATPQTPGQPTEEDPDIDWHANGSLTVYWAGVPNTGSGIAYRLERDSGTGWTPVVTTTAISYADSGSYADGTFIRYRVRAVSGVGYAGAWSPNSDGVTIDSDVPAAPAWLREGVSTDPDWDWDADGAYTVYWAGVANTGSGITYRLFRRIEGGAWQLLTTTPNTFYADSGSYPDGTLIEYQVVAVNGAGLAGTAALSDGIRIDSDTPGAPAGVTEELSDIDWDYDGVFTVYWAAVTDTGSGITYRLERNLNGGGWTVIASALITTSLAQNVGNVDGTTAQYRVTAINGVGMAGAPRLSDGVTVDSQAVPQPSWVREDSPTEPDRDDHPNADGAITVYWASVADTGSGIRYRLEKQVNGGDWTLVAANLSGVSYPDSGAYADNDFIVYRVTAMNGVLTESAPRLSDGMRIDTDTPAAPTSIGEGDVPGVDDDFDQDNAFYVFWTAPADTGSGLSYTIQRSRNGGTWEQAIAGLLCAATPCQWDDPVPFSNGDTVQYRLIAVNGAGRQSMASSSSNGITLDFAQPDSAVTTGGYYNAFNWPGMVRGTAADAISDVAFVDLTLRDTANGLYWNGSAWGSDMIWLRAVGALNWQYALPSASLTDGHTYDIRSRAADHAGNVETSLGIGSFTYASAGPQSPTVSSASHPVQTTWYNHNDPLLNWTTPSSVAPVVGYSYLLDQNPGTTPDAVADTTANTVSYVDVGDGVWYFHVRALDDAGNWGPAGHYRLNIDTATPAAPVLVSEENPDVDWDADGVFTIYWSPVANTGSGITYEIQRNLNGAGLAPLASGLIAAQYADNIGAADGTTVRYRVRAVNGVGLSSAWSESDGLTVDSDVPVSPGPVTEGDPTPDITHDADGSFTVYWNAVVNTGSGITYRLERQVNGGGYTLVAAGLTVTSYPVSGAYGDGDLIQYRVTAVNGVGTTGPAAVSSGVIIDNQTPVASAIVTEQSPDVDWDVDGNVRVYWSAVADTGSGITYRLERRVNGGGWTLVPGAAALTVTDLQVNDTYNDDDLIEFRLRATNGVGLIGAWTQSDGVRVDSSVPGAPVSVTENSPDIDFIADAGGALTVYWSAVTNTGSGITYRVERQVDAGGWVLIGTTASLSLADSDGPYADETFIRYRVTAVNGVGTAGTAAQSDGVRVDLDTPAIPASVGEGDAVGVDDDWDQDNDFYVFWNAVASTASGDTVLYIVQRSRNGGAWEQATTTTSTFWEDPLPYSHNDTVNYRVIAVNGAGVQSEPSLPSDGLTFDLGRPNSAVTTGGFYNAFSWPGFIYGTASDAPSGVAWVDITLRDAGSGQYWDGSTWVSSPVWLRAIGDTNWQYSFAPVNGHTYDVQSRAIDHAGNVQLALGYSSFTYAASGPQSPVVSSTSHPVQTVWYNHAAPILDWTTPSSGAGIQGYSIVLDQIPGTTPDTTLDTALNTQSYTGLADGTWYFHVRAQDNANNWGPAGHYRLNIDTTPPLAPAAVTEGSPDVDWDADGNVIVYWDGVTDLSGVTYTLERNINSSGWVQVAMGIAATQYADFSTNADGATVRYRVRATNGVSMHSGWTESDGMTIDSIAPLSPTPVTEDAPDVDWSATGAVTVRWAAVPDTGSGVTYRLERSVNGVWTTVGAALSTHSYADGGAYNDGDFIQYRVTAISGVGMESAPDLSDGMTIDNETPAISAQITEENPDIDWDVDGVFTVYWAAVADTGSGITYRLERNLNNTGWTVIAPALTATSYAQNIGNVDSTTAQYRVTAINGVGSVGAARTSDGVTVDSSTPGTPANVIENNPDLDYYPDASGAVIVYWNAVADTGSGITYRLERELNASGVWTLVAGGIVGLSYPDSGAYADDTLIRYRVFAVNGVGTAGAAGYSDGLRIDLNNPAVPANVGEGDTPGVDDAFDQDNAFYVFWDAVPNTATGDTILYTIERSRNGSPWEAAGSSLSCGGTPCRWDDPVPFSNGDTVQYHIIAVNGAGRVSLPSTTSSGITLDFAQPDSAVTTSGFFNAFNWPGWVQGTASDALSDVAWVDLQIQRQSDLLYWNGSAWAASATWLRANGTLNWQYALAQANLTDGEIYNLRSRATDHAGNVETTLGSGSFVFAGSGPGMPTISSGTHPVQTNWYNNNDPALGWTTPSSAVPVVGYSYVLDQIPATAPDAVADTAGNTAAWADLADGTWYFHVRAQDSAGNWGAAAHFRINIDTAAPSAPSVITEESPDVAWDADGSITVYWSAVTDLSGVAYRLEQCVNGGLSGPCTSGWMLVPGADALTTTSYPLSGFANGSQARFRVRTTDGVGLYSAWTESNGVSFDLTVPSAPAGVGEGDAAGVDDDWDQDNAFWVFWTASPATPSGITYSIERNRNNSGVWEPMVSGLTATQWEDPTSYSSGESVAYRITAHTGAGLSSAPSLPSDGLTLDFVRPDSAINTAGFYNTFTWPGAIQGTASDNLSDVAWVDITIRRQSDGLYWNGSAWGAGEIWLRATGAANWSYAFTPGDGQTYSLQSRATDRADNVETTFGVSTFNYASSGPDAPVVSSPTHPNPVLWYNNNAPVFNWTTPASGAGISGYSYVLDHAPDTEPDLFADTNGNSRSYSGLADGVWYFHVRALDNAGNWGPPGHLCINIDTTHPPAPAQLSEENPDVDWDADGIITLYWSAVNDTSPVTYALERSSDGGASWQPVAGSLTQTVYLDPVVHPDAAVLRYRVRATDAVGLVSAWTLSDGVIVDSETPAQPVGVGEGDVVGVDDAFDQDNTFYVFWDAVLDTGSGITYQIERSVNGGAWQVVQTGYAQTFWDDSQLYADTSLIRYRITAINGVGAVGATSDESSGIVIDLTVPDSAVTTGGAYGPVSWSGAIEGTASDATSGVALVHITLQRASNGQYWNGAAWTATPTWLPAVGGASWSYAFAPDSGESYTVQSRATDAADNIEISYGVGSFSYTTSEPDSAVTTAGLYVGASWPGQINGTAAAPMAAVSHVDMTIRRGDDLYWDGTDWVGEAVWLRAVGTGAWSYAFMPDDGETYVVHSRAADMVGNVEGVYGNSTFSYDAAAPDITAIEAASDSIYFYNSGLTADGGVVYYNSRPGEGAGQQITVEVAFDEPHPASLSGGVAFGGAPLPVTSAPWMVQYTAPAYAGTQTVVSFTVADTLGLTDVAYITFVQDNMPPTSRASIANEATNAAPIRVDWEAGDSGSGVRRVHLWVKYQPIGAWMDTGLEMTGVSGSFVYTPTAGSGTYYVATVAVDQVNNIEAAPSGFGDDQIDFDDVAPTSTLSAPDCTAVSPIPVTWSSAFDAKYTYLYVRYGAAGAWQPVAFSQDKSGVFNLTPTQGDGHYDLATVAIDAAGNQEAISDQGKARVIYDTTPPASVATSPAEWGEFDLTVQWSGDDTAIGSGIVFFDIQVKVGDGAWTDWLTQTTQVSATYTAIYVGEPTAIYHFRSRATDRVGHTEAWPDDPNGDATTLVHFPGSFPGKYRVFLPLVAAGSDGVRLPDLVVESVTVIPAQPTAGLSWDIQVTVKNIGAMDMTGGVWVDLYVDPLSARLPIKPNTPFFEVSSYGAVWWLPGLRAGESITLTKDDIPLDWLPFFPDPWQMPGDHVLYVQVDSVDERTANPPSWARVYESNETNNVFGPLTVHVLESGGASGQAQQPPAPTRIPRRQPPR